MLCNIAFGMPTPDVSVEDGLKRTTRNTDCVLSKLQANSENLCPPILCLSLNI